MSNVNMDSDRTFSESELQNVFYSSSYYLPAKSLLFSNTSIFRKKFKHINYSDELTIYFFNEMLPYIVEDWKTIENYSDPTDGESSVQDLLIEKVTENVEDKNVAETSLDKIEEKRKSRKKSISFSKASSSIIKTSRKSSILSTIREQIREEEVKEASIESEYDIIYDWIVQDLDEYAEITFKNGCVYIGPVRRKMFEGTGVLRWPDGAYYEGEFHKGMINGEGTFFFNDTSHYSGHYCNGWMHGFGSFYPNAVPIIYSGNWKGGKKHGKGWLIYVPNDYYEGEWFEDMKQGQGFRQYLNGTVYNGQWYNGKIHGKGICHFSNSDFYKGEWINGLPDGFGSYTWNASMERGTAIAQSNMYQGTWKEGKRNGLGVLYLGMESSKLASVFTENMKHGAGICVCGNGTIVNKDPLFVEDSPIHCKDYQSDISNIYQKKASADSHSASNKSSKMEKLFIPYEKKHIAIDIPVHETAIDINIKFHIEKMVSDYYDLTCDPENVPLPLSMWNLLQSKESIPRLPRDFVQLHMNFHYEENKLRKCIMHSYDNILQLYRQYSSLTCDNPNHKSTMSRMCLWQFYRDLEIHNFELSLIDTDCLLLQVKDCALETNHYPFESIYLWQFLHSILAVIYTIYASLDYFEEYKETGAFAQMFDQFMTDQIEPKKGRFLGQCLFKYKDLLPIEAVYELYKNIGEPHSIRTFLRRCCIRAKSEVPCYLKDKDPEHPVKVVNGFNAVATGLNFIYVPEDPPDIGEPPRQDCDYPIDKDGFYKDLKVFRKLGVKRIVDCIRRVCPLIENSGFIVNMNYELTFLEFYEIIIICGQELIKQHKLKKQKAEERELLKKQTEMESKIEMSQKKLTKEKKLKK